MARLTYEQMQAGKIKAETLQRLFTVITDERTAALAIWYVTLHDADEATLDEAKAVLNDMKPWRKRK